MFLNSGEEGFKHLPVHSDGAYNMVRRLKKNRPPQVTEYSCVVIPHVGIVRLAAMLLPAGERGEDERFFWIGHKEAVSVWRSENLSAEQKRTIGKSSWNPPGFFRDSGGGGWNGIRLAFNTHPNLEDRKRFRVADESGKCLENDCDFHLAEDVSRLCKNIHSEFDGVQFLHLNKLWLTQEAPGQVLKASNLLDNFIDSQVSKEIAKQLRAYKDFYSREGERVLRIFKKPGSSMAETAVRSAKASVPCSETDLPKHLFLQCTISFFIQQQAKMRFLGQNEGKIWTETSVRSDVLQYREEYHAARQGISSGLDLLQELQATYSGVPDAKDSRSHRFDRHRNNAFVKPVLNPLDSSERVVGVKFDEGLAWRVDPDPSDLNANSEWKCHDLVPERLWLPFLQKNVPNSDRANQQVRTSVYRPGSQVSFRTKATVEIAKSIVRSFSKAKDRVVFVNQPEFRVNARLGPSNIVLNRSFTISSSGQRKDDKTISVGWNTECSCGFFQGIKIGQSHATPRWCDEMLCIFRICGYLPDDPILLQHGFTSEEVLRLITQTGNIAVQETLGTPENPDWNIYPATGREAVCQAKHTISGIKCNEKIGKNEVRIRANGLFMKASDTPSKKPRMVKTYFNFHLRASCVRARFSPNSTKIPPPPPRFKIPEEMDLTEAEKVASGLLFE